jgi:hypothetical protein
MIEWKLGKGRRAAESASVAAEHKIGWPKVNL